LGINRDEVIKRFITSLPQRHVVPDEGRSVLSGVIIDLKEDGTAKKIDRILINEDHPFEA
ncbi:TPA: YmdB family metallophosphoesterase, partial [Staphylococcus pseudintermedius]